jgi:hypothetical protein
MEPWRFINVSVFSHSKNCPNVTEPKGLAVSLKKSFTYSQPISITATSVLPSLLLPIYNVNVEREHSSGMFIRQTSCSQNAVASWCEMKIVTEFMLSFWKWNNGSVHTCWGSYKKLCWVRDSGSCVADGSCSIFWGQIQNNIMWKICLKLYI